MKYEEQIHALSEYPDISGIAKHGQGFYYTKISYQQAQLDRIFGFDGWCWCVISAFFDAGADGFIAVGTLCVTFANGTEKKISGVGAASLRRNASTGVPIGNGIVMDFPKSNSQAFKNACESLAPCFGRDLRRDPELTGKKEIAPSANIAAIFEKRKERIEKINNFTLEQCFNFLKKSDSELIKDFGFIVEAQIQKLKTI